MKSTDQLGRLLTLVPYLQANPGLTAAEVADHYGTTTSQIIKDLNVLWYCGPNNLPGQQFDFNMDTIEAGGPIEVTNGEAVRRPHRFQMTEALALKVALAALEPVVPAAQRAVVRSTLAKISAVSGPAGGVAVQLASGSDQTRDTLARAIEARHRVQLSYDGLTRGSTSTPMVDPAELIVRDGYAYLRGWSLERQSWRTYRLDRVIDVVDTGERAADHGALPDLGETWFGEEAGHLVTLTLSPRAAWVTEYDPVSDVDHLDDGRLRATFQVVDEEWLVLRLLQLGNGVEAVEPRQAADPARDAARAGLQLYSSIG
ncbi:helix-turn-helix transcriptional regulator [Aestuariimicrobium sp. T2.26MG-19.2B]|uniref:helix-turn-helix transcriptional regulator n=1 Tax=Aestuariimicrobium sp. T2.26MG-19.2B TaxID=3040679 RepID=UPI0024775839|nr:WYL domain-containing protein [Aestuariimicrobium sp. T2.26MG-19.2B]CAI9408190.1 Protein PafC [Aestuariimicrobium sp. T2.26MG-19.2B]